MLTKYRTTFLKGGGIALLVILPMFDGLSCWYVFRSVRPISSDFVLAATTIESESIRLSTSREGLHKVWVVVNDSFYYFVKYIPGSSSTVVPLRNFARLDGLRFDPDTYEALRVRVLATIEKSRREWSGLLMHDWEKPYRKVTVTDEKPDLVATTLGICGLMLFSWLFGIMSLIAFFYLAVSYPVLDRLFKTTAGHRVTFSTPG